MGKGRAKKPESKAPDEEQKGPCIILRKGEILRKGLVQKGVKCPDEVGKDDEKE